MLKIHDLKEHIYNALHEGAIVQIKPNEFIVLFDFLEFGRSWTGHPGEILLSDFFNFNSEKIYRFSQYLYTDRDQLIGTLRELAAEGGVDTRPWSSPDRQAFESDMGQIQEAISQGDLQKAVPITTLSREGAPTPKERANLLYHLISRSDSKLQTVYSYFSRLGGVIGSSPEVFFEYSEGNISTMALAGTLAKAQDKTGDGKALIESAKDRVEHQIVVNRIEQILRKWGPVTSKATELIGLPRLWHLRTQIQAKVPPEQISPEKIIAELHPTPALGVESSKLDYNWLKGLNHQLSRGSFGAPITLVTQPKSYLSLVAIRNIRWSDNRSYISAGCGVVAESTIENEWAELLTKLSSIKHLLGIQE